MQTPEKKHLLKGSQDIPKRKFVLIDDDPSYTVIMKRVAEMEGIELDTFQSLSELGFIGMLGKYDVAIVDYDLGRMTGVEIGNYLDKLFSDIPMIMVSELERSSEGWPHIVKKFLLKSDGYKFVLQQALALIEEELSTTDGAIKVRNENMAIEMGKN